MNDRNIAKSDMFLLSLKRIPCPSNYILDNLHFYCFLSCASLLLWVKARGNLSSEQSLQNVENTAPTPPHPPTTNSTMSQCYPTPPLLSTGVGSTTAGGLFGSHFIGPFLRTILRANFRGNFGVIFRANFGGFSVVFRPFQWTLFWGCFRGQFIRAIFENPFWGLYLKVFLGPGGSN